MRGGFRLVAIGLWFAAALPILAADTGADVAGGRPRRPRQALIPQPAPRFAGRRRSDQSQGSEGRQRRSGLRGDGFIARIAPDGTVAFTEKRLPGLSLDPVAAVARPARGPFAAGTLANRHEGQRAAARRRRVDDRLPPPETTQLIPDVSRYRPDPREDCAKCQSRTGADELRADDRHRVRPRRHHRRDGAVLGQGSEPLSEGGVPGRDARPADRHGGQDARARCPPRERRAPRAAAGHRLRSTA